MLRKYRAIILTVATVALLSSGLTLASAKETAAGAFNVQGRVLAVNLKARTMSVKDNHSGQEYLVVVPEESIFKITFGKDSKRNLPQLEDVSVGDVVNCRVRMAKDAEGVAARRGGAKVVISKS
ncbi:MAG: hypothetical protein QOF02_368 [Blastocatellia bacterium]|jgi:hypothetical protein|nr:hypothetical protein [Blastocatellia bacterium]